MRRDLLVRLQRLFILVSLASLLATGVLVAQAAGYPLSNLDLAALLGLGLGRRPTVALIQGHAGYDSGAVCTDNTGQVLLQEVEVNARITAQVAERLRSQGVQVWVLDEQDPRLRGLRATVLLSLHSDSCVGLSGYKVATRSLSLVSEPEERLVACIHTQYAAVTGLRNHPETITRNMTNYYAFRWAAPTTPTAILEMGFLGGDRALLVERPHQVAEGVVQSLLCFLQEPPAPTPPAAP